MLRDLRYLFAYTLPASAFAAVYAQGAWSYAAVAYAFGVIPLLDQALPRPRTNDDGEEGGRRLPDAAFDALLYANVPILYALVAYALHTATTASLAPHELVGIALSVGIIAGSLGINVAHELGHRPRRFEQVLAQALLLPSLYLHFFIEHNRGHHRRVGTPEDPATSRFGESLYRFWVRSLLGGYRGAWALEAERLGRAGGGPRTWANQMIRFTALQVAYLAAVTWAFGALGLALAVAVAAIGVLLLESVNYIEHYGLVRARLPSGRYEPVTPRHSWNSEHELGRIVLYELTRHADHHYKSTRPYHALRYLPESPELPAGYPASILMALVPPVWRGVMDARVEAWRSAAAA